MSGCNGTKQPPKSLAPKMGQASHDGIRKRSPRRVELTVAW